MSGSAVPGRYADKAGAFLRRPFLGIVAVFSLNWSTLGMIHFPVDGDNLALDLLEANYALGSDPFWISGAHVRQAITEG
jgi:hypothetical protein